MKILHFLLDNMLLAHSIIVLKTESFQRRKEILFSLKTFGNSLKYGSWFLCAVRLFQSVIRA